MLRDAASTPDWVMTETAFTPGHLPHYESIFALANGYMGVRASLDTNPAMADAGFYVAGVYDQVHRYEHEIVNLPCWLGLGLNVDGFDVDLRKGIMLSYSRTLDMRRGLLLSDIVWRDAGMHTTRIETARLVHMADRHLALQWGRLTPLDYSANVRFSSTIDAWCVKYGSLSHQPRLAAFATRDLGPDAGILLATSTRQSNIRVAIATRLSARNSTDRHVSCGEDRAVESVSVRAEKGKPVEFAKHVAVFTSRDGADPEAAAARSLKAACRRSPDALLSTHAAAWAKTWSIADVRIDGDPRAQKGLRFSNFHLAAMVNPEDDGVSLAAKGLHGGGYGGRVFWDTEIYMLPFYIHTNPAAARALLRYRQRYLADARWNARQRGAKGAFYPWNSTITGKEDGWRGWQEHVGSDIAYGVDWYWRATGDRAFMARTGAALVFETARYWQSRVELDAEKKAYVIRRLTGPDEIHTGIDNNAFTNTLVAWHLDFACGVAADLKGRAGCPRVTAKELAAWQDISRRMFVPFDRARGFHEQFDGYFKLKERAIDRSLSRMQYTGPVQHSFKPTKVAQQADTVLMYWMFGDQFPVDVQRAGYRFYEPRCSHTSSLSRCIYAAMAARVGMADEALKQFMKSAENDTLAGTEMESESGIHAACMGGTWLAAITGFGGVWVRRGVLEVSPRLPRRWKRLAFSLCWKGRVVEVEATGTRTRLRTRGGTVEVVVHGQRRTIGPKWE